MVDRIRVIFATIIALLSCGVATASAGTRYPLHRLDGQRLAGTSSKTWLAIASPFKHPADVAGTDTPPVQTNDVSDTIAFFEFSDTTKATAFYRNLPLAAHLAWGGIQQYRSLAGTTGVPQPSRGLELRDCLWRGGPGQGGTRGRGYPAGTLDAAGRCSQGTPSTMGVAVLVQRGRFVVLSESFSERVIGGNAPATALTDPKIGASKYANSALALMRQVGIKV